MKKLLVFALSLPLVACVVGDQGQTGDDGTGGGGGGGGGGGSGSGSGSGSGVAGHITADTTWSGTQAIDSATTIDAGVTVTVAAGTTVTIKSSASLTIEGILDIQGTSAAKVTIAATTPTDTHGGLRIPAGGELRMHYAVQSGGGISTSGSGKATIVDSSLSNPGTPSSRGDFLVMNGGTLDMQFSEIGLATGDGTHCAFHFGGSGNTISVTHSTIQGDPYGLMFYGGTGAIFTSNNWENPINVDTSPGVAGDFSNSFFQGGAPTPGSGATLTLNTLSATRLLDAQPRP
ncbi:MAG: hypothetical protein H6Q90_3422 [Deltaproteobacteria bacterium]|nr:hypothetical protein [Deltaproteobacteria bacterium]